MKKKILVFLMAFVLSVPAFAAKFGNLKSPTNAKAKQVYETMTSLDTYTGVKKVIQSTDARGRTSEELHLAEIKESMHRFMCALFDESIDMTRARGVRSVDEVLKDLDANNNISDEDKVQKLKGQLQAVLSDRSLEVYSGSASGNNTAGEIMGIYDTRNDEVIYLGFTNCGSDD